MKMQKKNGFALITTLLMSVIVVMMLSAGIALLPAGRTMSGSLDSNQRALAAAEAGIEYARTRLQQNPNWSGDANTVVIDEPGTLWVREDEGNVIGVVWGADGSPSLFRLRFNFQNGDSDPDEGFDDPVNAMMVPHPYISFNSLNRAVAGPIWRGEESGDYEVDDSTTYGDVPRFAAVLYCQGVAGQGCRSLSESNLEVDTEAGAVSVRMVEAFIGRDVSQYGDSVVYGAMDLDFDVQNRFLVESSNDSVPPRARTLGSVTLNSSNSDPLEMTNGEVIVDELAGTFQVNGADSITPSAIREDSSGSFLELGWSQIAKAGGSDASMSGGTYVWMRSGGSTELRYFDVQFDPADPTTDPRSSSYLGPAGVEINSEGDLGTGMSSAVDLRRGRLEMVVRENVQVQASASGVTGVSMLAESSFEGDGRRPLVDFQARRNQSTPILTTGGDFHLAGKLHGSGAVTAEGDITVQGESLFRSGPDTQVAIYSRGDITIEPIPAGVIPSIPTGMSGGGSGSASSGGGTVNSLFPSGVNPFLASQSQGDVAFSGVVYAQGSFSANIGLGSNFHLRGVLVAYGGDSEAGETPGARVGAGGVSIEAKNAQLIYDSSFVATLLEQGAQTTLSNLSWRWF